MTERDLYEYLRYEKEIKRLRAKYNECELYMNSTKSPNLALAPGSGDGEERLAMILDRRSKILAKIESCRVLCDIAEKKLDAVSDMLVNELQINVFDMLYRKGYEVIDIANKLRYTHQHIYRQRKAILNIASDLK